MIKDSELNGSSIPQSILNLIIEVNSVYIQCDYEQESTCICNKHIKTTKVRKSQRTRLGNMCSASEYKFPLFSRQRPSCLYSFLRSQESFRRNQCPNTVPITVCCVLLHLKFPLRGAVLPLIACKTYYAPKGDQETIKCHVRKQKQEVWGLIKQLLLH